MFVVFEAVDWARVASSELWPVQKEPVLVLHERLATRSFVARVHTEVVSCI